MGGRAETSGSGRLQGEWRGEERLGVTEECVLVLVVVLGVIQEGEQLYLSMTCFSSVYGALQNGGQLGCHLT